MSPAQALRAALVLAAFGCGREPASTSGAGLFSHDTFFIVNGSHKALSCDQCHDPNAPGFAVSEQGVSCTGCHTDAATTPNHADVGGYAWATASCVACHKDGTGGLPANHDTADFPVTGTQHAGLSCSQCHGATKALADVTCLPCHAQPATDTAHAAIPATRTGSRNGVTYVNYQYATAFCLRCHADGQVNSIASHPRIDNGITGNGHAPFCLTCHTQTAPPGGKAWAASFGASSCLACHASNNP